MSQPFIVLALPRSRTFWLSRFLSYGGWTCGHEELRHVRSLEDVRSWLSLPLTGTAETAAAPWWRTLRDLAPHARVVLVRRPVEEVEASLLRLGIGYEQPLLGQALRRLDAKLDQVAARWPGAMQIRFADMAQEETCERIFAHCLGLPHDRAWWRAMAALNLQVDLGALTRYMIGHRAQLDRVASTVRHQTLVGLQARPIPAGSGETVIAEEPFRTFYRDGAHLFRSHLVEVGEPPDNAGTKNIPLLEALDDRGALQVMTARCNGRMVGYLVSLLSPTIEFRNVTSSVHTFFFADPSFRGLGMRLQRAALAALKAKGVGELFMRAGPRGSGPRLGTMFKRLGAEPDGELFRLKMEA
jgi:hypothetical protein